MRQLPNDWITKTIDNPRDRPPCPECHSRQTVPVFTPMYRCGTCGTTFEAYKPNQRRIVWAV